MIYTHHMSTIKEIWFCLQKLSNNWGCSHAYGSPTSTARATWGILCQPPGVLFWSTFGTQDMLNTPTIWTWDNSNLVKLDAFFLVVRCCKVATTSSSSLSGPKTSTAADWGSRQVFTIHPGESQGNPSQPYRGGTRTWSSTCKARRFGIHCDNRARQAFLSLSGCT